jgi:hypothetical protein
MGGEQGREENGRKEGKTKTIRNNLKKTDRKGKVDRLPEIEIGVTGVTRRKGN